MICPNCGGHFTRRYAYAEGKHNGNQAGGNVRAFMAFRFKGEMSNRELLVHFPALSKKQIENCAAAMIRYNLWVRIKPGLYAMKRKVKKKLDITPALCHTKSQNEKRTVQNANG